MADSYVFPECYNKDFDMEKYLQDPLDYDLEEDGGSELDLEMAQQFGPGTQWEPEDGDWLDPDRPAG